MHSIAMLIPQAINCFLCLGCFAQSVSSGVCYIVAQCLGGILGAAGAFYSLPGALLPLRTWAHMAPIMLQLHHYHFQVPNVVVIIIAVIILHVAEGCCLAATNVFCCCFAAGLTLLSLTLTVLQTRVTFPLHC